jgi:hypothetical protein
MTRSALPTPHHSLATMPDLPATMQPKPPLVRAPNKPRRQLRIRGKLFHAIELIVFEGLDLQDAAAKAGLTTFQLRQAFGRAHVIAHFKARREVFRAEVAGQNIHRAKQIRDAADNMPAVNAMKFIEDCGREQTNSTDASHSPHLTIRIVQQVNATDVLNQKDVTPIDPVVTIPNGDESEGRGEK